jgi:hypothetical protein
MAALLIGSFDFTTSESPDHNISENGQSVLIRCLAEGLEHLHCPICAIVHPTLSFPYCFGSHNPFFFLISTILCPIFICFCLPQKMLLSSQAPVAHACNPNYSGGRDPEDYGLKPALVSSSRDRISEKPIAIKGWWRPWVQTPVPQKMLLSLCWKLNTPRRCCKDPLRF